MLRDESYIKLSLELHLFFARIMKEHALFLEVSFMKKNEEFIKAARNFQTAFGNVLHQATTLSGGIISKEVLQSGEIITANTLAAEHATSNGSGFHIDEMITERQLSLNRWINFNRNNDGQVDALNEQVDTLLNQIIKFKQVVLKRANECQMFTTCYPLLIEHMLREAQKYQDTLVRIQKREKVNLYDQEVFWNQQMREHAQFIRGLLDPTEEDLILTADKYADEYRKIIDNSATDLENLTLASLEETLNFKSFKEAGNDGILNCKIKSIIMPILADHVLREANHFVRILKEANQISRDCRIL